MVSMYLPNITPPLIIASLLIHAHVYAWSSATEDKKICGHPYIAKYDNLPWTEGGPGAVPTPYNGLSYDTVSVGRYPYSSSFIPASGDQYAIIYGGTGGFAIESLSRSFSLFGFSYACASGVPQPACKISLAGYHGNSRVKQTTLIFPEITSGHTVEQFVMNSTNFHGWVGLTKVKVSIERADGGGSMCGGLVIDDLAYRVDECR